MKRPFNPDGSVRPSWMKDGDPPEWATLGFTSREEAQAEQDRWELPEGHVGELSVAQMKLMGWSPDKPPISRPFTHQEMVDMGLAYREPVPQEPNDPIID